MAEEETLEDHTDWVRDVAFRAQEFHAVDSFEFDLKPSVLSVRYQGPLLLKSRQYSNLDLRHHIFISFPIHYMHGKRRVH